MITPLLDKLRENGGTLYTFPSAQMDLSRVFANSSYTFRFSHFACLDFPDIKQGPNSGVNESSDSKKVDLDGTFPDYTNPGDDNVMLAEHLQNYVMNFETAILNGEGDDDGYDNDVMRTPAERVFFNWLQKVGGIEFEYADTGSNLYYERCGDLSYDPVDVVNHPDYVKGRTVKYIGMIDVVNSVEIGGDMYNEVYIHIPSTVGASHEVRFGSVTDKNYNGGNITLNSEKIIGRDDQEQNEELTSDLSMEAIYDYDEPGDNSDGYSNTYTGDIGYVIDFRDSFYRNSTVGYEDIMSMNELSSEMFEFNCVLIYYTMTDNSTGKSYTNLYGVLFLEEINKDHHITRYPKYKTTNLSNGNSYALKIDLKVDAYPTSSMGVDTGDGKNNRELLDKFQEYIDDMTKLQQTIDIFNRQQAEIGRLQDRVRELETLLYGMDSVSYMSERLDLIDSKISASGLADQEELAEMIEEINGRMDTFLEEQRKISSVNQKGYGISVKSVKTPDGDELMIDSTLSGYSINDIYEGVGKNDGSFSPSSENPITEENPLVINRHDPNSINVVTNLMEGPNLMILHVDGYDCEDNLNIYIDDTDISWRKGQTARIRILDYIDFKGNRLIIHTGLVDGKWCQEIELLHDDFTNNTPVVEITCIDDVMKQDKDSFMYEIIQPGDGSGSKPVPVKIDEITEGEIDKIIGE